MTIQYTLPQLGWNHFFQQQLSLEEWEAATLARVFEQQRGRLQLMSESGGVALDIIKSMPAIVVGDWLLLDNRGRFNRLLERASLFSRKAAGSAIAEQLIAANIDTVFIVCSMNLDFSLNRIERYLALAYEAKVEPVVVLTKADCCTTPERFVEQVNALDSLLAVVPVNALLLESAKQVLPWCQRGKTVALLGSSGVGKSTLTNTLMGQGVQPTQAIRNADDEGRHTTTARSIHLLPSGGLLLDTPGMRELQLTPCEEGVEQAFADITLLAQQCRFSDCAHLNEPGCAVNAAIDEGRLSERRLNSYHKLIREQSHNRASLAEKRAKDKKFGRFCRSVMKSKDKYKFE